MKYSQHMAVCRGRQCTQWGKKLETTVLEESTCSGTFPNGHLVQLTMTVRLKGRSSPGQDSLGKHSFHGRLDSGCICSYWPRGGKKKKVTSSFSGEQLSLCHPQLLFSPKPLNPGCAICCPALDAHCHDKWAQAPFNYAQSAKMQETMETGLCSASADPRHSSQQFSLISINSCPIHHTPQET